MVLMMVIRRPLDEVEKELPLRRRFVFFLRDLVTDLARVDSTKRTGARLLLNGVRLLDELVWLRLAEREDGLLRRFGLGDAKLSLRDEVPTPVPKGLQRGRETLSFFTASLLTGKAS